MLSDYLQTVDWSRAQFAMTAIYHWLFVPLTLGLSIICAIMETLYYRTGDCIHALATRIHSAERLAPMAVIQVDAR